MKKSRHRNDLGYKLYRESQKIFGEIEDFPTYNQYFIEGLKNNLKKFSCDKINQDNVFEKALPFPKLSGNNINEHFNKVAEEFLGDWSAKIKDFCNKKLLWNEKLLTEAVSKFSIDEGWQRYHIRQKQWESTTFPEEGVIIYDTETYVKGGNYPIIGMVLSHEYLYLWLPKDLNPKKGLISIGNNKLIVGHNVGFDLGKTAEPYTLKEHTNLWLDTQSMHIVSCGLASGQRWYKNLVDSGKSFDELTKEEQTVIRVKPRWADTGTTNSLVACYNYHVVEQDFFNLNGLKPLKKEAKELRDIFVKGSLEEIQSGIKNGSLLTYAVLDVLYTFRLFQALWPKFHYHKSSPVSLAGMLLRMDGRIPLTSDWQSWIANCDRVYNEKLKEIGDLVRKEANKLFVSFQQGEEFWKEDPWFKQLDWTIESNKGKYAGIPNWYRPFIRDPDIQYTTKADLTHLVLKLKWEGFPLIKTKSSGWCYKENKQYKKVPHYNKKGANVGQLITKNYLWAVEAGKLTSDASDNVQKIFEIAKAISYWTGNQKRIKEKMLVKEDGNLLTVAEPLPYGTITGRKVEKLILTLCSTKKDRVATELKSRIEAPKGWKIVGFDFDGQEMHLAALIADIQASGIPGSTPISFQVLTGNKKDGTDSHSSLSIKLEVDRETAKPLNFLMAYGGGQHALTTKISLNNRQWSEVFCSKLAQKTISIKKGKKDKYGRYQGGTDSELYNFMDDIISNSRPRLPMLGTVISQTLWPEYCDSIHPRTGKIVKEFFTGRANWLIQASAAEILDATLLIIWWLSKTFGLTLRYITDIHDDVRYLIPENQARKACLIFQLAHVWVWSLFHYNIGMPELPLCGAFLSATDIDYRMRKSVTEKTSTVSHDGSDEPDGEELSIFDLESEIEWAYNYLEKYYK